MRCLCVLVAVVLMHGAGQAGEAKPPATLMTETVKLLHREDFDRPPVKQWKTAKGKWEIVDGVWRGAELKSDMHGAVTRYPLAFDSIVIEYSFKLDGAKTTTLSINADKGHISRVLVQPTGFSVKRDADKAKGDKGVVLQRIETAISPGAWHTLVVELQGKEIVATLDGKQVAYGMDPGLDRKKANFGFTVAGESVSFKNLRVWEARPNKGWEATRAKLAADKK